MKTGRNSPCPCGSGRKYKHCCLQKEVETPVRQKLLRALIVVILCGGAVAALMSFLQRETGNGPRRVWSEEHQHWHTLP